MKASACASVTHTQSSLWLFDQIDMERVVYLDGDTLMRHRLDELFAPPSCFPTVPDVWMDNPGFMVGFNAGVLALAPSTTVLHPRAACYPSQEVEQLVLQQ
ncbi:hypothetical protein EVG20_g4591 [Dentipellis fragilis]|uniref:Hexosyltransferase n=1 Tax=Dentipellis fragilis TaxID=205917 RepID=A0A4Y9YXL2_9AGAM|nr:hypothetical protein EVG20_g4591 [Dentipellis fragilis]